MMMIMGKTDDEKAEGRKQLFAAAETLEGVLVLQGETQTLLRRRQRRLRGHSARRLRRVGADEGPAVWLGAFRRRQDPAPRGVAGALLRIERNQGCHAGRDEAARVLQEEASTS
jgi:hypothetical protein